VCYVEVNAAMQCPSCGFENIPGLLSCARCQSALQFGEVAVVPMRASALRLRTRLLRLWYPLRECFASLQRWWQARPPLRIPLAPRNALALSLIAPGLVHYRAGNRVFGGALFAVWTVALLSSLATVGSPWSACSLQLAIAAQALAIILLLSNVPMNLLWRLALGALVMAGLYLGIYLPLAGVVHGFFVPLPVSNFLNSPTVRDGDGLLYEGHWLRPRAFARGELVVYEISTAVAGHVRIRDGLGLDRILGLPGEHVRVSDGLVTVDGTCLDSPVAPLGPLPRLPTLDVTLRADEYFILPSRLTFTLGGGSEGMWWDLARDLLVVRADRVLGRVVWRVWPWSRWGRVE
jgi:hypothetical protein